jgi:IclR family acetate operon transcriptional repressor
VRRRASRSAGPARARIRKGPEVKTLEKALHVLSHLGERRRELSIREVARAVGLPTSTAYRLLAVLARHHYLQHGSAPGRYALGLRLAELGHLAIEGLELRVQARPALEAVMAETRETIHLMVPEGDAGMYIDRVESPQRIRVTASLGFREPLHVSAVGKAILAHLPREDSERILGRGLVRVTPRTVTDPAQLRRQLREIVARGFAIDLEEGEAGVRCVGAPVFDHRGQVVASISVSAPAYRTPISKLLAWGPRVRAAADTVSQALSFRPAAPRDGAAGARAPSPVRASRNGSGARRRSSRRS